MHIVHVISGLSRNAGGPAVVVPTLCESLVTVGCDVTLVTMESEYSDAALRCLTNGVDFRSYPGVRIGRIPYSRQLGRNLAQVVKLADVVHGNGIWNYTNWPTYRESLKQEKALVVSFHGSISNPQQNWRLRHRVAWRLLAGRYISKASCLHACTLEELKSIREVGLKNPVAIIPYGFAVWESLSNDVVYELVPEFRGWKTLLFLSRIHPTKGIYDLVEAWSNLRSYSDGWRLIIAGPGKQNHVNKLLGLIKSKRMGSRISYVGPLYGDKRKAAYQGCDVFVLPSYTENFGLTIGEALACGKPVIASHAVPWPALADYQCGWRIRNEISELASTLYEAMKMSDTQRAAMGRRGQILIEQNYSWSRVSEQMASVYEWLLGTSKRPCCVKED